MQDNMNPASDQGHVDREGAMAKSDLYKLANYSLKLFKKLHDDDQLEGWVQAKITKAADYIASVYHYLEYEMKFSEYAQHLDNVETLNESQREALQTRLFEAKEKMKELKKAQAKKAQAKEEVKEGTELCPTCGTPHAVVTQPSAKALKAAEKHKKLHAFVDKKIKDANGNGIPDDKEVEECDTTSMPMAVAETEHKDKDAFDARAKKGDTYKTKTGNKVTKTEKGIRHEKQYSDSYKGHGEGSDKDLDEGKMKDIYTDMMAHCDKKGYSSHKEFKPADYDEIGKQHDISGKDLAVALGHKKASQVSEKAPPGAKAKKDYDHDGHIESAKDEVWGSRAKAAAKAGKPFKESLKGGQKKLDKNHNNKLDSEDFKMLRGEKKMSEAERTMTRAAKGMMKYGKDGMKALAKAGKEGKSLEPVKAKYNKYDESTKPSAGMSKDAKSALVKKAKAGGDIGKPGKSFDKVAKAAGGGEKGKKIAAAAMWKNAKESVELQPVTINESADLIRIKELTQKLIG
jgi:hypothetical protein